ncbi:hypothetical protein EI42_01138 [Thermosporothrix hazakensis]|jgi:hypothetical protein|uniref:Carbohydrate-binding protein n=1 Tax=Thermosporothrix hazakensis TaxID=644383 RepID=A0A326UAS5_THEHA|nr:carbohydrate-binding protein [Thermosporothrix hazakensis]PZW34301.1 hypothetical protein EI42_01138 [Thermosporothrix hazakensis]GCE46147.1 hypothetical protein KTH_10160 [Thermosporothrix hazakensis]
MKRRVQRACIGLFLAFCLTFALSGQFAQATHATSSPDPNAPRGGVVIGAHDVTPTLLRDSGRAAMVTKIQKQQHQRLQDFRNSRKQASGSLVQQTLHQFWGVFASQGTHDGMMATQSVDPSYVVRGSTSDYTYTPTMKPYNACMEVTTVYSRAVGDLIWAWDWCGGSAGSGSGPQKEIMMDQNFLRLYTTVVNGRSAYTVQIVKNASGGNSWTAYLYNYQNRTWDTFYTSSGTDRAQLSYGWNIFEIYATRNPQTGQAWYCTEAKNTVFESSNFQLRSGGTWKLADASNSYWSPSTSPNPSDYWCSTLTFQRVANNSNWIVRVA